MNPPSGYNPADYPPGLVAIPATDWMYTKSVLSLLGVIQTLPPYSSIDINPQMSSPAANRNFLVERFLSRPDMEWILFLDSDQTPAPVTVPRLLSHNVDIVGPVIFTRADYQPTHNDLPVVPPVSSNGLQEVASIGTGCLLVRRRVIEAMPRPYFEHPPGSGTLEDVGFCVKARQLGFTIYLDTYLSVGHLHVLPVDGQNISLLREQPHLQELQKMRVPRETLVATFDTNGVKV